MKSGSRLRQLSSRGQRTQEKLLKAALDVFIERGYSKALVEDITRRAKVGYGTFYVYFKDKRHTLLALLDSFADVLMTGLRMMKPHAQIETLDLRNEAVWESLQREIEGRVRTALVNIKKNEKIIRVVSQAAAVDPAIRERVRSIERGLARRWAQDIRRLQKSGCASGLDSKIAAQLFLSMITGIIDRWLTTGKRISVPLLARNVAAIYVRTFIRP